MAILARRWSLAFAAVGSAIALAACGSSTHRSPTAPAAAPTATTTATATAPATVTATTSTVPESTATSSATVADQARAARAPMPPGCSSSQVSVSVGRPGAGLGHIGEPLLFRNKGQLTCSLTGYPGVALLKKSGTGQVQASRTPSGYLGGLASGSAVVPVVRVRPGQTISALLEGDDNPAHGAGVCPSYQALLITPPNQTVTVRLARPFSFFCSPEIHPVVAGTSGRQS
jgi:hypothetical protein